MSHQPNIFLFQGNIVTLAVDAIVNAANSSLLGGGGVDGAIHRAAGPDLLEECRGLNGCKVGQAKITAGYQLPAKHVIHTVGPIWSNGNKKEPQKLADCYRNSLQLAQEHQLARIAFPAISTGVYRFPADRAAAIALTETRQHLQAHDFPTTAIMVCFDERTKALYHAAWADLYPNADPLPDWPTA